MTLLTPDFGIIFWQTITFLVVLMVLSKFAWSPILAIVHAREDAVAHAVATIDQAQISMKQVADDRARVIEEAYLERERIISAALATQRAIIDQAHQEGLAVKEHLITQAKMEITKEEARAFVAVKANIGSLVVQVAEKLLVTELSHSTAQWALIERLMAHKDPAALHTKA